MNPASRRRLARLTPLRGLCLAAAPLLAGGCTAGLVQLPQEPPSAVRAASAEEALPAPSSVTAPPATPAPLPVDLDTVLRMAGDSNAQINAARARLHQNQIEQEQAEGCWLPTVHVGVAYLRHEGGIQQENGTVIRSSTGALYPNLDLHARLDLRERAFARLNAQRQVRQQEGEVARLTSETLLEAANTYTDLLAARTAEAILQQLAEREKKVLEWAENLYKQEPSAQILVESIRVQTTGRQQAVLHMRQQGDAAAAKLAYLLGLPADACLMPVDPRLELAELVDASVPCGELVARALASGPGIREMEALLALVQEGIDQARGPSSYLPTVEARMIEGAFGAGPGSELDWNNRWDLGIQVRWNLTEFAQARAKLRQAQAKASELHYSYHDLRGKLTLGVREALQAVSSGKAQLAIALAQVRHADKAYNLSNLRLTQRVEGSSTNEVMQAIRSLEAAQLNYLNLVRAHNKAQVRLLVLTGTPNPHTRQPDCR